MVKGLHFLLFSIYCCITQVTALETWRQNKIKLERMVIDEQQNIEWTIMPNPPYYRIKAGDCVQIYFENPYALDSPATYQSFDPFSDYQQPCQFSSEHEAECSIVDPEIFQIKFTKDANTITITGNSIGEPFRSPYSSRKIDSVVTQLYVGCDTSVAPLISGDTQLSAFQNKQIDESEIKFQSTSNKIAVTNALLRVNFTPKSSLPSSGRISIKVPAWYYPQTAREPYIFSSESMLDMTSEASFIGELANDGFEIVLQSFEVSSRSLLLTYQGTRKISSDSPVTLLITNFKNPVNVKRKEGFKLTTQDSLGYIIDTTAEDLPLTTAMQIPGQLTDVPNILTLGDANGQNIGRISEYNTIQIFFDSYIPFEQNCFLKFVFPKKLQLDENLKALSGGGIFKPSASRTSLALNEYTIDLVENIVTVHACQMPEFLDDRPSGEINFHYIKLPDYVTGTDPVEVYAYSDASMKNAVFIEAGPGRGAILQKELLLPGELTLEEFSPTNYYAFMENVNFTIAFTPSHPCYPSTQVRIQMPKTVTFDPVRGCNIVGSEAQCIVDYDTNILTVLNLFEEIFKGGQQIKLIIQDAQNPVGSRDAGPWSVTTWRPYDGTYFMVDGGFADSSFFALPGFIRCSIDYKGTDVTFYDQTTFEFTFDTEHNLPTNGLLKVQLPREMTFSEEFVQTQQIKFSIRNQQSASLESIDSKTAIFKLPNGHDIAQGPLILQIENIRTPRSLRPSSEFVIQTTDTEGYIIDSGGGDIKVQMTKMNFIESFTYVPMNVTNGALTDYLFTLNSFVILQDNDIFNIQLPVQLGLQNQIQCKPVSPEPIGVVQAKCFSSEKLLTVQLNEINQEVGEFQFLVSGIRNPGSTRKTDPASQITMSTFDYFNIQQLSEADYANTFVQTQTPGSIWQFTSSQSSQLFGEAADYQISFYPTNPIPAQGLISIEWTDQVSLSEESECSIETFKIFDGRLVCTIDLPNKQILIKGIFESRQTYAGQITLKISKITNPVTNQGLKPITISTFEDVDQQYAIDRLQYEPQLQCNYPCFRCTANRNFCTECWEGDILGSLMRIGDDSTCKATCDTGYTTDGDPDLKCTKCDDSCATCLDEGNIGDAKTCVECAVGYDFYDPILDKCLQKCPPFHYATPDNRCMLCSEDCLACEGKSTTCTACKQDSALRFLFENQCLESCPDNHGSSGGVCHACEYPCEQCSTGPQVCTQCNQKLEILFLYGPNCIDQCPTGFLSNIEEMKCEGCEPGCTVCDEIDQRICNECNFGLMEHLGDCVTDCPRFYLANFAGTRCEHLGSLDIRLIYFPFLIVTVTVFFLMLVGEFQKKHHLFVSNFLVLMGIVENLGLFTQIILTFSYGTWRYAAFIIVFYLCYVATNIVFWIFHYKRVATKDKLYRSWRNDPGHIWARRLMNVLAMIFSWKDYKLSYSGFFGYSMKRARFSQPKVFRDLQRKALYSNILFTYIGVIILNTAGLIDLDWGTQLYIMMVENLAIACIMLSFGLWEARRCDEEYLRDPTKDKRFRVMSVFDEEDSVPGDLLKSKDQLLNKDKNIDNLLVLNKYEEIKAAFGDRMCKSTILSQEDKQNDPRELQTWPNMNDDEDRGFPQPLPDPYPDNVYSRGLTQEQMRQMKYLSKPQPHKIIQAQHYDADQNLRKDALLVGHQRELYEVEKSIDRKKQRGRQNRYFRQIDNEDNEAGVLLGDDSDAERENMKAKNDLLDAQASLEAKREAEESELKRDQIKRKNREIKNKSNMLTEENLNLKRILENQRSLDLKEAKEIQHRILKEEERRQQALDNIEKQRQEQEDQKRLLLSQIEESQRSRMATAQQLSQGNTTRDGDQDQPQFNIQPVGQNLDLSDPNIADSMLAQQLADPKKSFVSSQNSPLTNQQHLSMLMTADDASALDNSIGFVNTEVLNPREFNEIDVLGDLPRDSRGFTVVPIDKKTNSKISTDRAGRAINHLGYLVNSETGDIISNKTGAKVFSQRDLDHKGELPLPYSFERYNFNPFQLLGTFFYEDLDDPLSFVKSKKKDKLFDELGRRVSIQGFMLDQSGNLIDKNGVIRFAAAQFKQYGGLMPKMYNYEGKTFEIQEVMGIFDRGADGNVQMLQGKDDKGKDVFVDKAGFMVNEKGYIINKSGHVCTRQGRVIFQKWHLRNGEFPKIFPFTKFFISKVIGDFEMDPRGMPLLIRDQNGNFVDRKGRRVNGKGYLIDRYGNVHEQRGKLVFEKYLLQNDGEIPEVFRHNLLHADSMSNISHLPSDNDGVSNIDQRKSQARRAGASDTSYESMMDESPSKYDQQNQRYSYLTDGIQPMKSARWASGMPDDIEEESEPEANEIESKRRRRRRKHKDGYIIEEVTGRDIQMATAYGGVAKPRIRKVGPTFAKINRQGLQTSHGPGRLSNPRMGNLTTERAEYNNEAADMTVASNMMKSGKYGATTGEVTDRTAPQTGGIGSRGGMRQTHTMGWRDQHPIIDSEISMQELDSSPIERSARKNVGGHRKNKGQGKSKNAAPKNNHTFEDEFEKIYKKDIDKFIDGSDFEVESLTGFSEVSKNTYKSAMHNNPRMRGLEKVYLQRLEFQNLGQRPRQKRKPPVKREFMDRFNDDPRYIAKGERLKFEIGANTGGGSSGKKKNYFENSGSSFKGGEMPILPIITQFRPSDSPERL